MQSVKRIVGTTLLNVWLRMFAAQDSGHYILFLEKMSESNLRNLLRRWPSFREAGICIMPGGPLKPIITATFFEPKTIHVRNGLP